MDASGPNIKVIVAAGVTAPDAIRSALPGTLGEFARRHGYALSRVSRTIHGHVKDPRICASLAADFGVEPQWVTDLLDAHAAKHAAAVSQP